MSLYQKLNEAVNYDPVEGVLSWAVSRGFKRAGTRCAVGRVTIDSKVYDAGKLAWFLTYGKWPRKSFRYLDGDHSNIKLSNLTERVPKDIKAKQLLNYWVKMTRTEAGFKVIAMGHDRKQTDLGTYEIYTQASEVQRVFLECSA